MVGLHADPNTMLIQITSDVEAPTFDSCPGHIVARSHEGKPYATIEFVGEALLTDLQELLSGHASRTNSFR